jgi:hypothetical protein
MSRSNHMEPNKITLSRWVDQALEKSLIKQNIKYGFRTTCTWPLNPKAMDNKFIRPSEVYIATNVNNVRNEKYYTI